MLAYPGYTVKTIRSELSMRRIRELIECCATDPPAAMHAAKLNGIICRLLGVEDATIPEKQKTPEESDREIKSALMAMGEEFEITIEG